jgi:hypothetical protein
MATMDACGGDCRDVEMAMAVVGDGAAVRC